MSFYKDEFDEDILKSINISNPDLKAVAENALRESLVVALESSSKIDELWYVFREYLTQYQYSLFVDSVNDSVRREVYSRVWDGEYDLMRRLVILEIMENEGDELREEVKSQIKADLESDSEIISIREMLESKIREELKPIIEEKLRSEIRSDPEFIDRVKQELKKAILGL